MKLKLVYTSPHSKEEMDTKSDEMHTAPKGSNNRKMTRAVQAGTVQIGAGAAIAVQSMCATKSTDLEATGKQIALLQAAGADLIRIAIDSRKDVEALAELRQGTDANLVVDIQESKLRRMCKRFATILATFIIINGVRRSKTR